MKTQQRPAADDLMTAIDAGEILGISVDMVRLLAKGGKLPFMRTIRGVRLFKRCDVEQLKKTRAAKRRAMAVR
jgi:excisionase family DNA binding protein